MWRAAGQHSGAVSKGNARLDEASVPRWRCHRALHPEQPSCETWRPGPGGLQRPQATRQWGSTRTRRFQTPRVALRCQPRPPARREPRTRCRQVFGLTVNTISTDARLSFRACRGLLRSQVRTQPLNCHTRTDLETLKIP